MKIAVLQNFKFKSQSDWIEYIFDKTDNLGADKIIVRLMNDVSMTENETGEEFESRKKARLQAAQEAPKKAKNIFTFIQETAGESALQSFIDNKFIFVYEKDQELNDIKQAGRNPETTKNGFDDYINRQIHAVLDGLVKQK